MFNESNREATAIKTLDFDHKKEYTCTLCNVKCSGIISYKLHIEGRLHCNKLARLDSIKCNSKERDADETSLGPPSAKKSKISESSEPFRCLTCQITCSGPESYSDHIKGSKHDRRVKEIENEKVVDEKGIRTLPDGKGFECTLCSVVMNSKSVVNSHIKGSKHRKNNPSDSPTSASLVSSSSESTIICKYCKVFLDTQSQFEIHSQSPRHKRKEEAYNKLASLEEAKMKAENGDKTDKKTYDAWNPSN